MTDHLGSVIGSFDRFGVWQGGLSYSPYGETRFSATGTAATTTSLQYIGGYEDSASGLYKLGARYYDPSLGRFTQYDPTGQEANPYGYGGCNPINNTDPSGTAFGLACGVGVLFGAGITVAGIAEILGIGHAVAATLVAFGATASLATGGALAIGGAAVIALGVLIAGRNFAECQR